MGKERLANLALLHIHYEQKINAESVIDMFASFHPRRMEMESLMKSQSWRMYLITLHSNDMHGLWVSDCNELTKGQLHMILSLPESKNKLTNAYCKYNPQDV